MCEKKFLNGVTLENKIIVIEDVNTTTKRHTQDLQKHPKPSLVVTNKHSENLDVLNSSNFQLE